MIFIKLWVAWLHSDSEISRGKSCFWLSRDVGLSLVWGVIRELVLIETNGTNLNFSNAIIINAVANIKIFIVIKLATNWSSKVERRKIMLALRDDTELSAVY